jgi:hypothetical protein
MLVDDCWGASDATPTSDWQTRQRDGFIAAALNGTK